eukprot:759807-Hanusia_phi.AAC.1
MADEAKSYMLSRLKDYRAHFGACLGGFNLTGKHNGIVVIDIDPIHLSSDPQLTQKVLSRCDGAKSFYVRSPRTVKTPESSFVAGHYFFEWDAEICSRSKGLNHIVVQSNGKCVHMDCSRADGNYRTYPSKIHPMLAELKEVLKSWGVFERD